MLKKPKSIAFVMQLTIEEPWEFCLFMMSPMSHPLTVTFLSTIHILLSTYHFSFCDGDLVQVYLELLRHILKHDFFLTVLFVEQLDIRNWIKNIEQHASDNVNKILVGNKADMDESKRVILLISLEITDLEHNMY